MTLDEQKALETIQGSAGFRVIQYLVEQKMKVLDSVSDVNENTTNPEAIFFGKKFAVKLLKEFLSDINLITKPENEKRKTYE